MIKTNYNIRVYALFIQDGKVLLTDEYRIGMYMSKFPGGGLESKEGLIDCIIRECREEMNVEAKVKEHFYTTDFYIASAFNKNDQLISVYYVMEKLDSFPFVFAQSKFDIPQVDGAQSFRWVSIDELSENELTFPVDKLVANKIKEVFVS